MIDLQAFREELWALRERLGISQFHLAVRLGVTERTLSRLMHGEYYPSIKTWNKLQALKAKVAEEEAKRAAEGGESNVHAIPYQGEAPDMTGPPPKKEGRATLEKRGENHDILPPPQN